MSWFSSSPPAAPQILQLSAAPRTTSTFSIIMGLAIGVVLLILIIAAVRTVSSGKLLSADAAPLPIDGKKGAVIPAASMPSTAGGDYGMQFWMFIQDWDYKFGQDKEVLIRTDPSNKSTMNPRISLHPTDNSLNVTVSIYPAGTSATNTSTNGDTYTCSVENVPLQTWFAVSVTVFQRNVDIFINGNLVKSCVLPGVPKAAVGDVIAGANGGFSGFICNVHSYKSMIAPSDARNFYSAGTNCSSLVSAPSTDKSTLGSWSIFGYTVSIKDNTGKDVNATTFLGQCANMLPALNLSSTATGPTGSTGSTGSTGATGSSS